MKQPEILLFESDGDTRDHLAALLVEAGYRVRAADNLEQGLPLAVRREADLLITNLILDDGSAFDVAAEWTSTGRPALGLSDAFYGPTSRAVLVDHVGLNDVVEFPVDDTDLLDRVEKLLPEVTTPTVVPDDDDDPTHETPLTLVQPPALNQSEVLMSGQLDRHDIATVLSRLATDQVNGALMLVLKKVKKLVYFEAGLPVGIKSNLLEECLGQMLTNEGVITAETCNMSLDERRRTGRPQGQALVMLGAITEDELEQSVLRQFQYKLHQLFTWNEGYYRYRDAAIPPAYHGSPLDDSANLIWQSIEATHPIDRAKVLLLPVMESPVRWSGEGLDVSRLKLGEKLRALFEPIDNRFTPTEILAAANDPDRALLLLYALTAFGVITFVSV